MDDLTLKFGATIGDLTTAVNQVKSQLGELTSTVDRMTSRFKSMGETIAGVFGIGLSAAGLNSFVRGMAEAGLHSEQLSAQLGVSGKQMGELRAISKLTGVDMDGLAQGISRIALNVQHATRDAFTPQAQALKVIGLNAKDLIGLPADQYFNKLAEAVSRFNPSLNLTNALMQLGGRGIAQMLPALLNGREHFEKWQSALANAKAGLEGFGPKAADTHARLAVLDATVDSFGKRLFIALKPAIDVVIDSMTKFLQSLSVEKLREFAVAMTEKLANGVITLVSLFMSLGRSIDDVISKLERMLLGAAIGGTLGLFGGGAGAVGGAIIGAGIVAAWDQFTSGFSKGAEGATREIDEDKAKITTKIRELAESIKAALAGMSSSGSGASGGKLNADAMDVGAKERIERLKAGFQMEISVAQQQLERKKVLFDLEAQSWQKTETEKVQATKSATEELFRVEALKLQQMRDLWPANSKEWAAAERERVAASERAMTEIARLNSQLVLSQRAVVSGYASTVETSWNGALRGMLAGTTTFTQAMKSMVGDLILYWIAQLQKKLIFEQVTTALNVAIFGQAKTAEVAVHAAAETSKTAATEAGVAARTGAEQAGALSTLATLFTSMAKAIAGAISQVFAGVTAFFAPTLGPAAPAAAAPVAASVAAAAALPSLDVGGYVLRDGLARIHAGETITPASVRSPFDGSMGGGGGPSIGELHVHNTGGKPMDVQQVAKAIADVWRMNPRLRPAF